MTIDTRSLAITSCNDAFAEVLGRTADDVQGCPITDFIDDDVKSVATAVLDGIGAGYISSVDGIVDLLLETGSWPASFPRTRRLPHPKSAPRSLGFRPAHIDPGRILLATLDDDWRIIELTSAWAGWLGLPVPGRGR